MRKAILLVSLVSLAGLVLSQTAFGTHTHPANTGAKKLTFTVVPAFKACAAPNSTHGTPLGGPSCTPPAQVSTNLTTGETATNQFKGTSSFLIEVICTNAEVPPCPAAGDQEDVKLTASATDVRCRSGISDATKCGSENGTPAGKVDDDYNGGVQGDAQIRITDAYNGAPGFTTHATVVDLPFPVTGTCAETPTDATKGSTCSVSTSADAVVPGVVKEGKKANVEIGQIHVNDGGADGVVATTPNLLFAVQGIYIP